MLKEKDEENNQIKETDLDSVQNLKEKTPSAESSNGNEPDLVVPIVILNNEGNEEQEGAAEVPNSSLYEIEDIPPNLNQAASAKLVSDIINDDSTTMTLDNANNTDLDNAKNQQTLQGVLQRLRANRPSSFESQLKQGNIPHISLLIVLLSQRNFKKIFNSGIKSYLNNKYFFEI